MSIHTAITVLCVAPVVLAASSAPVLGQPFSVPIDPNQSELFVEVCIGTYCDDDSSPVAGEVIIALDSIESPTQIWLHDFDQRLTETIDININAGILGRFDATGTGIGMSYADPNTPLGPEPIVGNAFKFSNVPTDPRGVVSYTATGILCAILTGAGVPCSGAMKLSELGTQIADEFRGTLTSQNRTIALRSDIDVTTYFDPNNPGIGHIRIYGTVRGEVYVPCTGDVNGDGKVDAQDLTLLLAAWFSKPGDPNWDPRADLNGDNVVNAQDLTLLLADWFCGT